MSSAPGRGKFSNRQPLLVSLMMLLYLIEISKKNSPSRAQRGLAHGYPRVRV